MAINIIVAIGISLTLLLMLWRAKSITNYWINLCLKAWAENEKLRIKYIELADKIGDEIDHDQ